MLNFGKWACEAEFTKAKFIRSKTYIEEIDGELKITCAGMPEECYKYVNWNNFKSGLTVPRKINF